MFIPCECCVVSRRVLCVGLISRPGVPKKCSVSKACDHEAPSGEAMNWNGVKVPQGK